VKLYAILRREGWRSSDEVALAAERSLAEADELADDVRWIRTYVLEEGSASLGTICLFEARSPEALRLHAHAAGLPVTEIVRVTGTVVVNSDPVPLAA
jgi:hypothetical protein